MRHSHPSLIWQNVRAAMLVEHMHLRQRDKSIGLNPRAHMGDQYLGD